MDRNQVAGVAGQPQPSDFNGCDSFAPGKGPAKSAGNPRQCRTSRPDPIRQLDSKARRTKDKAERMKMDLTKAMAEAVLIKGNDAVTPYLRRQMTDVLKPGEFPRVRVQGGRA